MSEAPMKAVLVGLGMVADMHANAIAATEGKVKLHGVFARRTDQARAFADQHGVTKVYSDFGQICADPAVDFVILATPPDARANYVAQLAAAGKPVLLEKPIERDAKRAREIVETCEAANVPAGVLLQHRARPAALELHRRVAAGALGQIGSVEVRVPWWRDQGYYDAPGRGTFDRDGGGVMITQAIHTIDMMLHLAGPVTDVQGLTQTTPLHRLEAEDFAGALLRFASGAVGTLMASVTHYPGGAEEIVLNGTKASARLTAAQLIWTPRDGAEEVIGDEASTGGGADPMAFSHAWHQAVIEDFALALRENRPPLVPARSALAAQALIDAIGLSSRTGQRITLEAPDG